MSFLSNFMHLAKNITDAERGLACDSQLSAVDSLNLDEQTIQSAKFLELASQVMNEALTKQSPVITNNIITDPAQAPVTNTSFSDLRIVVSIPLASAGVVYLDRPIRYGVIPRELIERLTTFGLSLLEANDTDLSVAEMVARFQNGG